MANSICIIIPYFGQWPSWMPYFLLSCAKNPTIDWLLYSDCGPITGTPSNVRIVETSFSTYCEKVSQSLGIHFSPTSPYKLCDIKPCLGLIHEQEIVDYVFWAFGDIDVVYGDLRRYFTDERLAEKSLFSTHARRISGHLCLIRNNDQMRYAFKRAKNWRELLEINQHVAFDEKAFSKVFLRHKNSPKWYQYLAKQFDPWLKLGEFKEAYSTPNAKIPWVDGSFDFPKKWIWDNGLLTNDATPSQYYPYFHFFGWKNGWSNCSIHLDKLNDIVKFTVSASGAIEKDTT